MKRFSDIVGLENAKRHLGEALELGRVSHAYVFSGEQGAGKHTLAETFAAALLCESPVKDAEGLPGPCGHCASCLQCETGNHPDIIYVRREDRKTLSTQQIRDVRADVAIRPYSGKHKIYIFEDAETMTPGAQNALLKTLEEPPAYAVLILLAAGTGAFLPTVMSRVISLRLPEVPVSAIAGYLVRKYGMDEISAGEAAAFAGGRIGRAEQLAAQEGAAAERSERMEFLLGLRTAGAAAISEFSEKTASSETDFAEFLALFLRDMMVSRTCPGGEGLLFRERAEEIRELAERCSPEDLRQMTEAVEEYKRERRANIGADTALFAMLLSIREHMA